MPELAACIAQQLRPRLPLCRTCRPLIARLLETPALWSRTVQLFLSAGTTDQGSIRILSFDTQGQAAGTSMGSWSSTMGSLACVLPCSKPQHSIHDSKLTSSPRLGSAWPGLSLNTLLCPILRLQSERRLANFNVGIMFQEHGTAGSRCERVISSRCRARPTGIRYTLA